jgi:CubicO group peptidase (beta-lactamase class C family)
MKRTLLSLLLLPCVASAVPSLDEYVGELLRTQELTPQTGLAVVVVKDGQVLLSKGYGLADRESQKPVTADTLFAIGSTTKAFTSTALSLLVERGRLDWNRPVKSYLPTLKLSKAEVEAQLTATDMLSHRSGLPRHDFVWYLTPFDRLDLFRRMAWLDFNPAPEHGFRRSFQYNNLMYMAAGLLLERIDGRSWQNFVAQEILSPLGMSGTRLSSDALLGEGDIARPYVSDRLVPVHGIDQVAPAGSMVTSVRELEKWLRFHLEHGRTADGRQLLSEAAMDNMYDSKVRLENPGRDVSYGLGWVMDRTGGQNFIIHDGNIDGYSATVSFSPPENIGVAVLVNQDSSFLSGYITQMIYQKVLSPSQAPATMAARRMTHQLETAELSHSRASSVWAEELPLEAPPVLPPQVEGRFEHPAYGEISLHRRGGRAVLSYYTHDCMIRYFDPSNGAFECVINYPTGQGKLAGTLTPDSVSIPFEAAVPAIRFARQH